MIAALWGRIPAADPVIWMARVAAVGFILTEILGAFVARFNWLVGPCAIGALMMRHEG